MSLYRCLLIAVFTVLLSGCAKKVAPDGGPKDITPATVIGTEPATGATNVTGTTMRFVFDEYVDRSVRGAFSVMPTARFTTSYAGDVVDVEFLDTLSANTTYVVTLGSEYTDIRGNKPAQAVSVVFSTGPDIDTGTIAGVVEDISTAGIVIFAYPHAEALDTSFSPATDVPPYRLPVGTSGQFTLNGLADGTYRIMAVLDANKNGVADASEPFAMATQDVVVKNGSAPRQALRVGPAIDVTPPQVVSARSTSKTSVQITFSENVRIAPSAGAPFTISDSTGASVPIGGWYQNRAFDDRAYLRLRDTLTASSYNLTVAAGAITDSIGLLNADATKRISFRGSSTSDTAALRIVSVTPKDSTLLQPDSVVVITFSDVVDATDLVRQTILNSDKGLDSSKGLSSGKAFSSVSWDGPTRLVLRPAALSRTEWTTLSVPLTGLRNISQMPMLDTTVVRVLKATERVDPGSIQGVVIDSADFGSPLLFRVLSSQRKVLKSVVITSGVPFTIDSLPAGEVQFDVVHDRNMNGQYDHGSIRPYQPAEAFFSFRRKVVVRARWTIEDVYLVIPPRP